MQLAVHDRHRVVAAIPVLGPVDAGGFDKVVVEGGQGLAIRVQTGILTFQAGGVDADGGYGLYHSLPPGALVLCARQVSDDHAHDSSQN